MNCILNSNLFKICFSIPLTDSLRLNLDLLCHCEHVGAGLSELFVWLKKQSDSLRNRFKSNFNLFEVF